MYCKCGTEIHDGDEMCQQCREETEQLAVEMGYLVDDLFLTEEDYRCKDADEWYAQCQDMRVQMM